MRTGEPPQAIGGGEPSQAIGGGEPSQAIGAKIESCGWRTWAEAAAARSQPPSVIRAVGTNDSSLAEGAICFLLSERLCLPPRGRCQLSAKRAADGRRPRINGAHYLHLHNPPNINLP